MNAPDKHTANMRRPAGPVLSPFQIPRDQEKGLTCGSQRQKQAKSKILVKTIRIQCWKQQKNPLYIFLDSTAHKCAIAPKNGRDQSFEGLGSQSKNNS